MVEIFFELQKIVKMKIIMQKGGKSIHSNETKDNYKNNTEVVPHSNIVDTQN